MCTSVCQGRRKRIRSLSYAEYAVEPDNDLGAGGNGFVLQGWCKADGRHVAIKVVRRRRSSSHWPVHPKYGRVPYDVMVMELLDHDNIVRMLDVFTDDRFVFIVSCF